MWSLVPNVVVPSAGNRALCLQRRVLHRDTSITHVGPTSPLRDKMENKHISVKTCYIRNVLDASYQWVFMLISEAPADLI